MRKIFYILITLYVLVSGWYLLTKNKKIEKKQEDFKEKVLKIEAKDKFIAFDKNCPKYAFGRLIYNKDGTIGARVELNLRFNLKNNSACDILGTKAVIYELSDPIGEISFQKLSENDSVSPSGRKAIYTLLKNITSTDMREDIGVIAVFHTPNIQDVLQHGITGHFSYYENSIITGNCDTIFYKKVDKKIAHRTRIKHSMLKADFNNDGAKDILVLAKWYPKSLPKGVRYTSIFVLLKTNNDYEFSRRTLFRIDKMRKSKFYIDQIIDLDGDGNKEIVIKKIRKNKTTFIVYKYNTKLDSFDIINRRI